ncbi:MAG: acetyl-CoA carboxylase biotin carboxylase subunit [Anaerolineae bacterium]|nr:acetyl-CoA carboxylase biotin carboxylase subunit [Anaerolineae bacterium]
MNEPATTLRQCLIANRGEIAVRVIRACRELGIRAVAVYSEADAQAQHVRLADEAILIGGAAPAESYLNIPRLLEAARQSGCDCVHPGYGFLSESEAFAETVIGAGLRWVGPGPEAIRLMGVKTEARALMQRAGVPVVPGFQSDTASDAEFRTAAVEIGFPVMVKAAGGGGGKGIRVVYDAAALPEALAGARREAQNAFGDPRVFLEKYIETARHVEIQVLADQHGHTVHLFERECSAQRRHQKIVEESPSPLLNEALRAQMGAAAVEAARAVGYVNAGTVEFIATPEGDFYFLEMNTRLQVEHPVTEAVTGLDLVKLQFAVAAGEALPFQQSDLRQRGHAIECRLYAEDPANHFLPAVGTLLRFIPPEGPGIRVDSGVQSGDTISIHYDPMIAKIIAADTTRAGAIRRMQTALAQTVILGTTTNLAFLRALLAHPAFLAGTVDTRFVDAHLSTLLPDAAPLPDVALIAAALHDLHRGDGETTQTATSESGSPWARLDGFRLGQASS